MSTLIHAEARPMPERLTIARWHDPPAEEQGHPATSPYVEQYWLPVIGPTATWLLRRLDFAVASGMTAVDPQKISLAVGTGFGTATNSIIARAFKRLDSFECIDWHQSHVRVRSHLYDVPLSARTRWPEFLKAQHDAELALAQVD